MIDIGGQIDQEDGLMIIRTWLEGKWVSKEKTLSFFQDCIQCI